MKALDSKAVYAIQEFASEEMTSDKATPVTALVELLEKTLESNREGLAPNHWEESLAHPAREFLRRPGKQFRGALVESAFRLCASSDVENRDIKTLPPTLPLLLEILHAGSLIVDDIEDDSDTRRGALALHKLVGIPVALNTGNWMYFWALKQVQTLPMDAAGRLALLETITESVERCHRGQALDLSQRMSKLPQSEVTAIVRTTTKLKTGALMELATAVGAIAAGAPPGQETALRQFGCELGEGLQMLDDLGSLLAEQRHHKAIEDLRLERPTWPWAWLAQDLSPEAFVELQTRLGSAQKASEYEVLAQDIAKSVAVRGRERVHSKLALALSELAMHFESQKELSALEQEISRLENSYE